MLCRDTASKILFMLLSRGALEEHLREHYMRTGGAVEDHWTQENSRRSTRRSTGEHSRSTQEILEKHQRITGQALEKHYICAKGAREEH